MKHREWNSIEDVVNEFRLPNALTDMEAIKSELKRKRLGSHPDRTGGDFASKSQKELYLRLSQAIDFVEQQAETTDAIVPANQISALAKAIEDGLAPIKQAEPLLKIVEEFLAPNKKAETESSQKQFLSDYQKQVQGRYVVPKFTSGVFAAIFTGTLVFTDRLKDNVGLSPLMHAKFFPHIVISMLALCGYLFIRSWNRERNEKNQAQELTSDAGLQRTFSRFCRYYLRGEADRSKLHFKKLEYADSLRESSECFPHIFGRIRSFVWQGTQRVTLSFPLAERLAEIHLARLRSRRVIQRVEMVDLDECYEVERVIVERICA